MISKIKTYIYSKLIKHPKLDALQHVLRTKDNNAFFLKSAERDPYTIQRVCLGNENVGKPIFLINYGNEKHGFCALLRTSMIGLIYADELGVTPCIEWNKNVIYHYSDNVDYNPYEIYFEQPFVSSESARSSYSVFISNENHTKEKYLDDEFDEFEQYVPTDKIMSMMVEVTRKYIKIVPKFQDRICDEYKKLFERRKVLGIHYRGTDFMMNYNNHPVGIIPEDYYAFIDMFLEEEHYDAIFLATDDINALDKFKDRYQEEIIFYDDTKRTTGNVSVAFEENPQRKDLGYEVLRDVVTLSKCNAFIGGLSNVSICAVVFNEAYERKYDNMVIINNGINHNNNNF